MILKEQLISIKTSELAIERGFDRWTIQSPVRLSSGETHYLGVTQAFLQKWLREVHNKHIQITAEYYSDDIAWQYQVLWPDDNHSDCYNGTGMYGDNGEFNTYEKALEAGLQKALRKIRIIKLKLKNK